MTIRRANKADLPEIARMQSAAPEASHWDPASYLEHECVVAVLEHPVGFLVLRQVAADEHEILNLAVDPVARRQGVARALLDYALREKDGACFLEVRASNESAIALYHSLGFTVAGRRKNYYSSPPEDGIVMKFVSC